MKPFGISQTIVIVLFIFSSCFSPKLKQESATTLGRYLFFDPSLSITSTKSCGSCHNPRFAFTDGYKRTLGVFADVSQRNTQTLINISFNNYFNWADTVTQTLEQQMERPLFSHSIIEMGLKQDDASVLTRLKQNNHYKQLFQNAFPKEQDPINWKNIKYAIASYIRTLNSMNAPYDLYKKGKADAISPSAKRGEALFFSTSLNCGACHTPPYFGADSSLPAQSQYYNVGLYHLDSGNYANNDNGLFHQSKRETDKGKFRVPTLRNLLFTAPYFHDGSAETIEEALSVFEQGGRNISTGIWKGDGTKNPYKSHLITGYKITDQQRIDLVNFLFSLSDSSVLSNPLFSDPFHPANN